MITRDHFAMNYSAHKAGYHATNGVVKTEVHKGIAQTWAIVRPCSSPTGQTINGCKPPKNHVEFAGTLALSMAKPRVEMDPSNPNTWQRPYSFRG